MNTLMKIIIFLLLHCLSLTGNNSDCSNSWGYDLIPSQNRSACKIYEADLGLLCLTSVLNDSACNTSTLKQPTVISINNSDYLQSDDTSACTSIYKSSGSSLTVAMCCCNSSVSRSPTDLCINITRLGAPETLNISVQYEYEKQLFTVIKSKKINCQQIHYFLWCFIL